MKILFANTNEELQLTEELPEGAKYYILNYYELDKLLYPNSQETSVYVIENIELGTYELLTQDPYNDDSSEIALDLQYKYQAYAISEKEACAALINQIKFNTIFIGV